MSDLLSQLGSLTSSLSSAASASGSAANSGRPTTPLDQIADAFRRTKEQPLNAVKQRITETDRQIGVFNTLNSRIQSLNSAVDRFSTVEQVERSVQAKRATSSVPEAVTVNVTREAAIGTTTVKVNRLATNDTLISARVNSADVFRPQGSAVNLPAPAQDRVGNAPPFQGEGNGTYSFQITAGTKTFDISIDIAEEATNEDVLRSISRAINTASEGEINASFVRDTPSTGRLSLISSNTGTENAISFVDTDGVLAAFGLTEDLFSDPSSRTEFTDTAAGFRRADASTLDSRFELNGITVTRSSNSIDDVIDGATFNLLRVQTDEESAARITTEIDTDTIVRNIDQLLSAFNTTLSFFSSTLTGALRNDITLRNLRADLRQSSSREFEGELSFLSEIGVRAGADGTLSVANRDALRSAVTENSEAVATLLQQFGERLTTMTSGLTSSEGLISRRQESLRSQSQQLTTRRNEIQQRIDTQVIAYRRQYEKLLVSMNEATSQFGFLGAGF